jgi:fructose-bisphosphate aldolase class I
MAAHLCYGSRLQERRAWLSDEKRLELEAVVAHIGQPGMGISACDESGRTINPRFEKVGVEATEEKRRAYRQMLFEADGAPQYVSAAILDPETVFQKATCGTPLPQLLSARGILPGVKPSLTTYKMPGCDGETVMQGLDNLAERLKEYKAAGCVFAKWRSPLTIDIASGKPSQLVIEANMRDQARYALICQSEGIVPIVEPDVVLAGDHTLEDAIEVNVRVLTLLYTALADHGVHLDGTILKVNMVNAGKDCSTTYSTEEIADANLRTLRRAVPVAVRTINYLSGGQPLNEAAARLDTINKLKAARGGDRYAPWNLSYSWSAAIQMPLFDLCKDSSLEKDAASGLPVKAMSQTYVAHLKIASSAAIGSLQGTSTQPKHGEGYAATLPMPQTVVGA